MEPPDRSFTTQPPASWRHAVLALIASRWGLMEIESKAAARSALRRLIFAGCCAICLIFGWAMLLAGAIAAVAATSGVAWGWIALTAAALHLAAALLFGRVAFAKGSPAFPVTRAEFIKDRQWLESIQTPQIQPLIDSAAAARHRLANEATRWRQRLDVPSRLRHSLEDHPAAWMLGALGAGIAASGWLRRKTPAPPPAPGRKKSRGLPASLLGLALTAVSPLAKAWLADQLKHKLAGLPLPAPRSPGSPLPPFNTRS